MERTHVAEAALEYLMGQIRLLILDRTAWARVADDPVAFAVEHTLTLGAEPDLLRTVGQHTVAMLASMAMGT